MAQSFTRLPDDAANLGKKLDTWVTATAAQHREAVVVGDPTTDAAVAAVSAANGLQVDVTRVTGTVAVTESGTWTVQPGNTANTTAWKVDGSAVTQPVSAATLPLPAGASTAAKQPALGTAGTPAADVLTIQGAAAMTKLLVTPDSVALPANQSVNANQIGGVAPALNTGVRTAGTLRVTVATDDVVPVREFAASDTVTAVGRAAAPAAGTAIATIAAPGAGVYEIYVYGALAGTSADPADTNNLELRHGAVVFGSIALPGATGNVSAPVVFRRVTVAGGEAISINATGNATAGSVYVASVIATKVF